MKQVAVKLKDAGKAAKEGCGKERRRSGVATKDVIVTPTDAAVAKNAGLACGERVVNGS